eukprot:12148-Heterococcus_DN1.PRE.2
MRALFALLLLAVPVASFAPHAHVLQLNTLQRHQSPFTCKSSSTLRMTAAEQPQDEPEATLSEARSKEVSTSSSPLGKVKKFFSGDGENRQKLGKLGLYALLSYGFVSNASYAICLCVSWYLASKRSGLSPLAPGQWQFFLTIYGSTFLINNVIRPFRLALSVALAPIFDRFIAAIMKRTGRSRGFATGVCVVLVNVIGTTVLMGSGIVLASAASGVPIWARAAR